MRFPEQVKPIVWRSQVKVEATPELEANPQGLKLDLFEVAY